MKKQNNRPITCLLLMLLSFILSFPVFAQQEITIRGLVTDSLTNEVVEGVTIEIRGSTASTKTGQSGEFSIRVVIPATLVFSSIGHRETQLEVTNSQPLHINLTPILQDLEEVVVVGYGVQKKTSVTAAVSTLKGDAIDAVPVANLSNTLGGRVAGVIVKQGSGEPGRDGSNIFIRGISSTGNSQPLLVVDGIPRDFTQLDPNNIETFTILKDAAAVAPFGVAGANGVILVTTKRGTQGKPTLTYNGYVGFQNPTVLPAYLSSYDEASLKNAAAKNAGLPEPYSDYALQKFKDGSDPDAYPNHDVWNHIVSKNALLTNHNVELSGGSESIRYYGSFGYQEQEGMWETTTTNRFNWAVNLEIDASPLTTVTASIIGRANNRRYPPSDQNLGGSGRTGRIFELAGFAQVGYGPLFYSNGMFGSYVSSAIFGTGYEKVKNTTQFNQLTIDQKIPFIDGLSFKGTFAYDPDFADSKLWKTPMHVANIDTTQRPYVITDAIFGNPKPLLVESFRKYQQFTYQASLNYAKSFSLNDLTALVAFESKSNDSRGTDIFARNYNLTIDEVDMGSPNPVDNDVAGTSSMAKQLGLVYRLTYGYADKYLVEASGRYDGSYYFAPGNRFGFFPAFSLGWRISEENFLKDRFEWLTNLKLRGSYGEVGALAGSPFQYLSSYGVIGAAYGFGGTAVQGVFERAEANPNITWERAKKLDVGLELGLWNGRVELEADYFFEKRSNMLLNPNVIIPTEYGIGLSQENAGIMSNRGIELALRTRHSFSDDLTVSLGGNFTYAKNKLLQVFETDVTYNNPNRRVTGRSLGTQFGYEALGYFQLDDFDADGNLNPGIAVQPWGAVQPGDIRYADTDGNGKIDESDIVPIGHPNGAPLMLYGISPSVSFKGFTIDALFQGAAKTDWYYDASAIMPFWNGMKPYKHNLDYWTPENPNAKNPRLTTSPTTNNSVRSSFWVGNAAYLRLKTITLSYTLPTSLASRIGLQHARVYAAGQNLLTWTDLLYDPEIGPNNSYNANSAWSYPQQKVVSLGITIVY
ncbi:SusC/RagA family TonB-linked outer membrane protein [Parapedobacter pyrenivorans]|uniref:SusC/RagA family TonB-linked outer membrane protein n=1 Tax=Parapedobacter pyrenivorans TaxID=1305674 RepID=A0A917MFC9_9SPHI|nr:TonB-dependent receptor [Parapedobacter pyrenivorans]GGH03533.1 SusC/RagA family TonB-linked outer membrane protein [Parapedobacter pyrenivorans]